MMRLICFAFCANLMVLDPFVGNLVSFKYAITLISLNGMVTIMHLFTGSNFMQEKKIFPFFTPHIE